MISNGDKFEFSDHIEYVRNVVEKHGPSVDEFDAHRDWYSALNRQIESGEITQEQRDQIRSEFGDAYSADKTMLGHVFQQPLGYPGDYLLIDKIYSLAISEDPRFERYDQFFQSRHAAVAVRNRKLYLKELVRQTVEHHQGPVRILNLACGPCRDVSELFQESPSLPVSFVCVDVDKQALEFGKNELGSYSDRVTFEYGNILRYKPAEPFHLIWSAGLFDYFNDRIFARVLGRYLPSLVAGGELVIGNFGDANPTKGSMEALANWYLHHRSDLELENLAREAGATAGKHRIIVGFEPTGVNRFLHIRNTTSDVRWDMPHRSASGPKWHKVRDLPWKVQDDGV